MCPNMRYILRHIFQLWPLNRDNDHKPWDFEVPYFQTNLTTEIGVETYYILETFLLDIALFGGF